MTGVARTTPRSAIVNAIVFGRRDAHKKVIVPAWSLTYADIKEHFIFSYIGVTGGRRILWPCAACAMRVNAKLPQ